MKIPSRLQARMQSVITPFVFLVTVFANPALATSISTDLQALVTEGNTVNAQMSSTTLTEDNSCTELGSITAAVEAFTASIETLSNSIPDPVTLDTDSLNALDSLTFISANMAAVLPVLSADLTAIMTGDVELADINSAMSAMLKLSDDIGTMADRILEMADKILLMSDNIGDMADRILLTQTIQSANIALTQSAMLTTQQNIIVLTSTVSTLVYNSPLGNLISVGDALIVDMNNTPLSTSNMSSVLADFQSRVDVYLNSVMVLFATVNTDSAFASHYIDGDTLTMMGDLSVINKALAQSLNAYASAINTLAPDTDIAVLNDAIDSMLRLVSDIGVMANRIVEMGDRINIMADNIGIMATRINETQTLQQSNLDSTQSNLTTAQITSIQILAAFGL